MSNTAEISDVCAVILAATEGTRIRYLSKGDYVKKEGLSFKVDTTDG